MPFDFPREGQRDQLLKTSICFQNDTGTIKFILPEFVSYSGERGVLCVGNISVHQSHVE